MQTTKYPECKPSSLWQTPTSHGVETDGEIKATDFVMEILKLPLAEMLVIKECDFSWQLPQGTENHSQEFPGEYGFGAKGRSGLMQRACVCLGS